MSTDASGPSPPWKTPAISLESTKLTKLDIEERNVILIRQIAWLTRKGYEVTSQTDTTAQLVKYKRFSCLLLFLSVITLVGWLPYLLIYWASKDKRAFIAVNSYGQVAITG